MTNPKRNLKTNLIEGQKLNRAILIVLEIAIDDLLAEHWPGSKRFRTYGVEEAVISLESHHESDAEANVQIEMYGILGRLQRCQRRQKRRHYDGFSEGPEQSPLLVIIGINQIYLRVTFMPISAFGSIQLYKILKVNRFTGV